MLILAFTMAVPANAATEREVLVNHLMELTEIDDPKMYYVKKIGNFGGWKLFYGVYYTWTDIGIDKDIYIPGCFLGFNLQGKRAPDELGLFYVKGNKVLTMLEMANEDYLTRRQIYKAGEKIQEMIDNGYNDFHFELLPYADTDVAPYLVSMKTMKIGKFSAGETGYYRKGSIYKWTSTNPESVSVDQTGTVRFLKKGKAKISGHLVYGGKITQKVKVINNPQLIKDGKKVKDVYIHKNEIIKVKLKGKVKDIKNVYTNTNKAKVISGRKAKNIKIKGLEYGTTTVKIKVNGVKTLKLRVHVQECVLPLPKK